VVLTFSAREETVQALSTPEATVRPQQEELQALQRALQETRQQLEAARQVELQSVQTALQETRQQLQAAQEEADRLRQQAAAAVRDFTQAEQELATAQGHAQTLRQQCQEAEQALERLQIQTLQIKETAHQETTNFRQAEQTLVQGRQQLQQAAQELATIQRSLGTAQEERDRQRQAVQAATQEWRQLWTDLWQAAQKLPDPPDQPTVTVQALTAEPTLATVPQELLLLPSPADGTAQERLLRFLNDAWSVERHLTDLLQNMIEEVADSGLRAFLEEQRRVTHEQQESLEIRLTTLGQEPRSGRGFFQQMLTRIWDAMRRPQDELDRTLHDLMKSIGATHFKIAMYLAVEAMAKQAGDAATAELARRHLHQEQSAGERLQGYVKPLAARAAQTTPATGI
jgi:ferritin-like metal-binding protein YciE